MSPNRAPQKRPAPTKDWHPADIVAALKKQGTSLARLSRLNKYSANSLSVALGRPWPKAEKIIAAAIGVTPQAIWPTRYHDDGSPIKDSSPRNHRARKAA